MSLSLASLCSGPSTISGWMRKHTLQVEMAPSALPVFHRDERYSKGLASLSWTDPTESCYLDKGLETDAIHSQNEVLLDSPLTRLYLDLFQNCRAGDSVLFMCCIILTTGAPQACPVSFLRH